MQTNTVTSRLHCGLGNLMFQIAATISYAKKHNKQYKFYKQFYTESYHGSISQYQNNIFKNLKLDDLFTDPNSYHEYKEPYFHYQEIPYFSDNIVISGYFQSSKYFDEYPLYIKDFFNFSLENNRYQKLLDNDPVCSIHVRRGDYLKLWKNHCVQDITYYQKAVQLFDKETIFFVISDDIRWCKDNFNSQNFGNERRFIFSENKSSIEDFYCSMKCQHNIIGNSTFSWWSAWMNSNKDKIVVCPNIDRWFGPALKHKNPKDIICNGWQCI